MIDHSARVATTEMLRIDAETLVRKAKRSDGRFEIIGLGVLVVTMIVLLSLIVDFMVDGLGRINVDFLINYPSRRPGTGRNSLRVDRHRDVDGHDRVARGPARRRSRRVPRGIRPKNLVTNLIEINVTNFAGVPSIIYGLLALGLFVQTFRMGQTVLVAGITLALLILPIIIVATREALRSIPIETREAAYGLGADKWQTIWMYLLPAARPGILTGAIVGMSRAIGETAPLITIGALTFIAFLPPPPVQLEFPFLNFDWLFSPFTAMPIQMFNWISRPQAGFHINAAATGIILLAMTLLMNGLAIWLRYRIRSRH